jgi:hypothetical protein
MQGVPKQSLPMTSHHEEFQQIKLTFDSQSLQFEEYAEHSNEMSVKL